MDVSLKVLWKYNYWSTFIKIICHKRDALLHLYTDNSFNAYLYCNNNPIVNLDLNGTLFEKISSKQKMAAEHLNYNTWWTKTYILGGGKIDYINGQGVGWVSELKYGAKYMDYNGCELIAIYNALKKLKKTKPLYVIIYHAETMGGLWFNGWFGTYPDFIAPYIKSLGVNCKSFSTTKKLDAARTSGSIFIVCYRYPVKIHTVMVEVKQNNSILVYNESNKITYPVSFKSFTAFMKGGEP